MEKKIHKETNRSTGRKGKEVVYPRFRRLRQKGKSVLFRGGGTSDNLKGARENQKGFILGPVRKDRTAGRIGQDSH